MMEITEGKSKDGQRTFKNVDLRSIGYGDSVEVVLVYDTPLQITTRYGIAFNVKFLYEDQEVSCLIGESYKTDKFGVSLADKLKEFKAGDKLKITKEEGRTSDQRTFRFFKVKKIGEQEVTPQPPSDSAVVASDQQAKPSVATSEVKLNLDLPTAYTDKEQALIDNLKKPEFSHYNNEQRIAVFTQNGIETPKATEIVSSNFK